MEKRKQPSEEEKKKTKPANICVTDVITSEIVLYLFFLLSSFVYVVGPFVCCFSNEFVTNSTENGKKGISSYYRRDSYGTIRLRRETNLLRKCNFLVSRYIHTSHRIASNRSTLSGGPLPSL